MILLTKLILAHLIGDFILQPKSWVKEKEQKTFKSPKLYLHALIHLALMFLIVWDASYWVLFVTIAAIHLIIDIVKLWFQTKKTKRRWFFIDQALHLITIFAAYAIFTHYQIQLSEIATEKLLLLVTCLLFLTQPVSLIMQTIFSKWDISKLTEGNESLKDAGKYIGILERILVFIFIIANHWEAVGFLITAKSVFRFGDLKESKHRKLTEYILIGTLISFVIAIVTGILFTVLTKPY